MYGMEEKAPSNTLPAQEWHCLVAEDNAFALDIMSIYLQRLGFVVDDAANGQIALQKYLSAPDRYRIIFMDMQMPIMGGYEATQSIRRSGCQGSATLPIVAMSGDFLNNLWELGFNRQLKKPFQMQVVSDMIRELVVD